MLTLFSNEVMINLGGACGNRRPGDQDLEPRSERDFRLSELSLDLLAAPGRAAPLLLRPLPDLLRSSPTAQESCREGTRKRL